MRAAGAMFTIAHNGTFTRRGQRGALAATACRRWSARRRVDSLDLCIHSSDDRN
jgi:hypothetical protein